MLVYTRDPISQSRIISEVGLSFISRLLIAVFTFLISCSVAASGDSLDEELLLFDDAEMPVILSASRLQQSLGQAPASITILDRELIEQSGARSLVDLLHLVPGFQIGRPTNGDPVATYHGQSTRYNPRLQLIIDGRPTYVPLYGGIPWSELPISITDVERVEITRAPNAATYGPNSFYAVISVTTRSPASGSKWYFNTEVGGNDYYSSTLTHNFSEGNLDARVTLQVEGDEGFENIPDTERARLLSVHGDYQINNTDALAVSVGAVRGGHIEVDRISQDLFLNPYEETTNAYAQFVWQRVRDVDDSTKIQYYYNYFDVSDSRTITLNAGEVFQSLDLINTDLDIFLFRDTQSTRSELEIQHNERLSPSHRISYGGAIREDTVQGEWLFADNRIRRIQTARLFAHSEYQLGTRLAFNSGLLAEYNSLSGNTLSPRASINYKLREGRLIRLAYSRGVRSPLLLAEDGQIEIDAQIGDSPPITDIVIVNMEESQKPEFADVFDLAFAHYNPSRKLNFNSKLSYQLIRNNTRSVRINDVEGDLVDQTARFFTNDDETFSIKTLEFELDVQPLEDLRLRLGYSRAFDLRLPRFERLSPPRNTLSIFAGYNFGSGVKASAEYYYTSRNKWNDARVVDVSRLNRLDLRLEKQFTIGKLSGKAIVQTELELSENISYTIRNEVNDLYFAKIVFELP